MSKGKDGSPKVDKNNANTVEGMVHDGCHKRSLSPDPSRVFVETENAVICLGRDTDNGGIKYVEPDRKKNIAIPVTR